MEERNILWGELVGGLLIVGCSIALVVTLWRSLESIPYFPFLLSAAITLALYGAGQYTLHHWKLTSTSRGLLVITLLLTPLNLLLLSDAITRGEASVPIDVGVKLVAVALFAWVARGGGRDILTTRSGWRWLLALAVVGAPATQLIPVTWFPNRQVDLLAWLALGYFAAGVAIVLRDRPGLGSIAAEHESLEPAAGIALLSFVGLAAFGLLAAWGLHIARSSDIAERIAGLALPLALAGVPIVEAGLLVQRRTREGGLRATGTAVALAGFIAITGALTAAWPDPLRVLLVSTATGLFITRIAFRESLAWAHAGAIPALALATVVGYHGLAGHWLISGPREGLATLFFPAARGAVHSIDPEAGVVLAAFALLLAGFAELLAQRGSHAHAVSYALGAVASGLVGLFLVSVNGNEYPIRAAVVYGGCAAGLLASNYRWQLRVAAHGGLWLILVGSLWAMHAAYPNDFARWGCMVSLEALGFAGLSLGLKGFHKGLPALLRRAGRDVSLAAVILAGVFAVLAARNPTSPWHTGTLFTLALTGFMLTRLTGSPVATYLASCSALLGLLHLNTLTIGWEPIDRAVLVALLVHATLAIATAFVFRRSVRLFALPLWRSSLVSTGFAALLLLNLPGAHAMEWAGCTVWLGLVWLVYSLVWRDQLAFSGFQIALGFAAVYCGVAWIEMQNWQSESQLAFFDPVALHVYSVALGLLGLMWVIARHLLQNNPIVRELGFDRVWSAERVTLAGVVVFQLLLAAGAILPEVRAELTTQGFHSIRLEAPELVRTFGPAAWVALGVLILVVLASWRLIETERTGTPSSQHIIGLLLLFLTVPVIWAGTHAADKASASALRWGLGMAFVIGSGLLAMRITLRRWLEKIGFRFFLSSFLNPTLLALLAITAGVVVLISVQVAEIGLSGRKPSGPIAESLFATMGPLLSNLVPLALVVLGLAGTAGRERSSGYAFAGGVVFTATLAAGYALGVVTAGEQIDGSQRVVIWLLACGGAALWAIAWLAAEYRIPGRQLLAIQTRLGFAGLIWLAAIAILMLVSQPDRPLAAAWSVFGQYGWFTLALATGAAIWQSLRTEPGLKFHTLALTAVIAGVMAACSVQPWDEQGKWLSFHVLAGAWVAVGIGLIIVTKRTEIPSLWLDGIAAALTIMAIRGGWSDTVRPWAPASLAVVASVLMGTAGIFGRSNARVYISVLLTSLASTLLWLPFETGTVAGFLLANAAGLAVASAVWSAIAIRDLDAKWHAVTDIARGIALVFLGFGLAPTLIGDRVDPRWLTWSATIAATLGLAVALWDAKALIARGGLFAVGVAAVLLVVSETTDRSIGNIWQTPVVLAAYALVVAELAVLVSRGRKELFHLPERGDAWGWLLIAQGIIGAIAFILGVRMGLLAPELAERLSSSGAVLLLVGAAALLLQAVPLWANILRYATVGLGVLVFATAAWAGPDPTTVAPWLHRNAWLFVALAMSGILASELSARSIVAHWYTATRSVGGISVVASMMVLVVNLLQQVPVYDSVARRTPLEFAPVLAMMVAILGLIALLIRFALREDRDPLGMSENGRTAYVYLAELLIVLLFTHIRFNVPDLFSGQMVRYWTFTVMALAFVGIGLAEFFERRKINVLATPLRRTGVLLPLIPLPAFWLKPSAALSEFASGQAPGLSPFLAYLEKLPQHFDTYAWLWSLAGGLYALVALSRKSFGWALLAALASNAALWAMLTHQGVPFLLHPQAWVIPLALIVLISEHVNRQKLEADLSNGLRYLGVSMIYTASAADMFIAGVGNSVWLPVILAVFCVVGVLLGIMLRVRAFLFLGVGFLLLDVFAMIWHAAVDLEQTWVWYVSGIVLGVAILTLFAVFEKRKKKHAEG